MSPASRSAPRFRVLGPPAIEAGRSLWPVPGGNRQLLLVALLVAGAEGLPVDRVGELLRIDPHGAGGSTLRSNLSRLRTMLAERAPTVAVSLGPNGYVLELGGVGVDHEEFAAHVAAARAALGRGDHEEAADRAGLGLGLWRGPALGRAGEHPDLLAEVVRLEELRGVADEVRAAALLELDRHSEAIGELTAAVERQPLREELHRLLMLALARADRQVEALRVYEDHRRRLAEVGTEPSPRLRDLDRRIARNDASLARRRGSGAGRWPLPPEVVATAPLVGRHDELELLRDGLGAARQGGPVLVVVEGEAGVGKSHLVARLAEEAHAEGAIVLAGAADEVLASPYGPFVRALRHFREQGGGWAEEVLAPWWPELARLLPEARAEVDGREDLVPTDPRSDLLRLLDALAGWLGAVATTTPVVLVLEDLHWAGDPTLLALRRLATPGGLEGVLVVATVRSPEPDRPPLLDEVLQAARRAGVLSAHLTLTGLDAAEVGSLVDQLRGDLGADRDFAERVTTLTSGNPLFVGELVGDLTRAEIPRDRAALPSAGALVARRLQQVDPEVARVLGEAAVVGSDLTLDHLVAVSTARPEAVLNALDEAIEAGLLQVVPGPRQRVRFTHAVVRDALVARLGRAEQVDIHRRAAAALLALPPSARAQQVEALARHAYEAAVVDGPAVAVDPLVAAGDAALDQRAYRHAAEWYERALALVDRPGAPEVDRVALLAAMGDAQRRGGDDRFRASILSAAELARAAGDEPGLARAALVGSRGFYRQTAVPDGDWIALLREAVGATADAPPATRALLLASLASELVWDDPDEARFALADEALALARLAGEPTVLGQVLVLRLTTVWAPDTVEDCRAAAAEALVAGQAAGDPALHCHALRFAAGAALELGDREEADRLLAQAEEATDEVAQPDLQWHLTLARAAWALLDGDLETASARAGRSLALGMAAGQPEALAFYGMVDLEVRRLRGGLGEIIDAVAERGAAMAADPTYSLHHYLAAGGRADLARPVYEAAMADLAGLRRGLHTMGALVRLATLAARFGDRDGAGRLYDRLAPFATRLPQAIVTLPVGHHHLGALAATAGRDDLVEGHLAAAVAFAQRAGTPLHEAETHLVWAGWADGQGAGSVAAEHRERAEELARPRGAERLLRTEGAGS